jgi:hypothetical protein
MPGYKLRRLYKKSVKKLNEDLDLKKMIMNQKALQLVHDKTTGEQDIVQLFLRHSEPFVVGVASDDG